MDVGELANAAVRDATELSRTGGVASFRAVDEATGDAVIVKILLRDASPEVRARFDHDQQRLVDLSDHANLVRVRRFGYTDAGHPFVVSDLVPDGSMADQVGAGLDGPGVVHLGVRIAGALETAHRHHVVHGDLRPEDIRVDAQGEPRLTDLGIAMSSGWGPDRATDAARIAHAAPEQLERHIPDVASDVYALGSILYALLAGHAAFVQPGDTSAVTVGMRIASEPPPDLVAEGVPPVVAAVITKAMAKDPAARWTSAEAMGLALQQAEVSLGRPITPMSVLGSDSTPAPPVLELEHDERPPPPPKKSNRLPILAGIAALVVLAAVGAVVLLGGDDGGEPDGGGGVVIDRDDVADITFRGVSDDSGAIALQAPEFWGDVDGRPLDFDDGTSTPDVVVAEDAGTFLDDPEVSGAEVTAFDLTAAGAVVAGDLLSGRSDARGLGARCTSDLPPEDATFGGIPGLLQRFEGCDGTVIVLFAGVQGTLGVVVETHLVDEQDELVLDEVLASLSVDLSA